MTSRSPLENMFARAVHRDVYALGDRPPTPRIVPSPRPPKPAGTRPPPAETPPYPPVKK